MITLFFGYIERRIRYKMKDRKIIKEIIIQVVAALLIQMILYGIVYIWSYFNKEKLNITICSSTKNDNGYATSINIKNYQNDKSIDSIIIWSDADININDLNYKDIESYDNKIIIKNIPPSYDGTIIAYSKEKIDEKNTRFETEEKRTVNFLYTQKEEIISYWKQIVPNIVIYIVIYTIMIIIINIFTKRQLETYNEKVKQIEKEHEKIEKECERVEKRLDLAEKEKKEMYKANLKLKIFLHRKLRDYAKELEFYRNLIKNVVNESSNKNDICYQITKSLKTFKTLEKVNLEDLEIDSLELSEVEEKEIRKELKE